MNAPWRPIFDGAPGVPMKVHYTVTWATAPLLRVSNELHDGLNDRESMMKLRFEQLLLCLLVLPGGGAGGQTSRTQLATSNHGNADAISARELREYLAFIASDETEGRATPSRGLDVTAQLLAGHLARWKLRPGGDSGTFFQRIGITRARLDPPANEAQLGDRHFTLGKDYVVNVFAGTFSGSLVYVSHGWVIRSKGIDAYRELDVRDKIVIVAETGLPAGVRRADLSGPQGDDWESPQPALQRRGARAMIMVPSFGPLLEFDRRLRDGTEDGIMAPVGSVVRPPLPVVRPSIEMFNALFEGESQPASLLFNRAAAGDPVPSFALDPARRFTLRVGVREDTLATQNVIAMVKGSDAVLAKEYVIVSAHYDHLGIGAPVNGDSIYNGADDDGSGSAAVLAMARAMGQGARPRRSVLFIWHAGEERQNWGSKYFVQHPTVPLSQIVAALNLDMVGRTRTSHTDTTRWKVVPPGAIYVVGAKRMSRELGEINDMVNARYLRLAFDTRFDAPDEPTRLFMRSDHLSYAERGVPVIFYYGGEHEDFHQPSDSADRIDYQNLEKVARTVFATTWELANRSRRPLRDVPRP